MSEPRPPRHHLLVTNDFPPKVGGIQSYLWELWRRMPAERCTVLTTPYAGTDAFDRDAPMAVERAREFWLLPRPGVASWIRSAAERRDASLVVLDPAVPLGAVGPRLDLPYAVVLHGSEVTVPGRLPGLKQALRRVLLGAELVVAAGGYPLAEAERAAGRSLPSVVIPPGVDVDRFRPLSPAERAAARRGLGLPTDAVLVHAGSRLVPRKGIDVVLEAAGALAASRPVHVVVSGSGRDRSRLARVARRAGTPATFLGRVPDEDLPALYGCADVFAMLCRTRWGGLEQEGFGIVFLEAAASGVPQIAGRSGGAHEAVRDGETGFVVDEPTDVAAVTAALARLVDDAGLRERLGRAARVRAEAFSYDRLAARLADALA